LWHGKERGKKKSRSESFEKEGYDGDNYLFQKRKKKKSVQGARSSTRRTAALPSITERKKNKGIWRSAESG